MVFKSIFIHYIKNLFRNGKFETILLLRIIIAFFFIYICSIFVYSGFNLNDFIKELTHGVNTLELFNSFLIYLFSIDFFLRHFFQKQGFITADAYLHLPIKRNKIIAYILFFTLFNFFNLSYVLFIVPFSIINILPVYGILPFCLYLVSILLIIAGLSFLALLVKNLSFKYFSVKFIPGIVILMVFIWKYSFDKDPGLITINFFSEILKANLIFIISIAIVVGLIIWLNIFHLKYFFHNLYGELKDHVVNEKTPVKWIPHNRLNSYLVLEIYLILRNRRLSNILLVVIYLVLLTYYLFISKEINDIYLLFFWFIILSGIWGYSYAQYLFSWESSFFDFISSIKFDFQKYLKSKHSLITFINSIVLVIIIPLILTRKLDIYLILSAALYNAGIGTYLVFYTATFNKKRIDLGKSMFFNWQGYDHFQILSVTLTFVIPLILLLLLRLFFNDTISFSIINLISIISLINQKKWFIIIQKSLSARKYINLEGYRK